MKKGLILLASTTLALVGCSATSPETLSHLDCPTPSQQFNKGSATSKFIEQCLGTPKLTDKRSDGRYIYVYRKTDRGIPLYLFNKDHKLVNSGYYQDTDGGASLSVGNK